MTEHTDFNVTLPSVESSRPCARREPLLLLTIVFHPDTRRIGERMSFPRQLDNRPYLVGRNHPLFRTGAGAASCPLEDRHVSRQALELEFDGNRVLLRRLPASSRCRLAGLELQDEAELTLEQLRAGVPLLLAHSVVLLLRLSELDERRGPGKSAGTLLRGSSAYMDSLREEVATAAGSDQDVLVCGETGTGKELVAASIHQASRRDDRAMVTVNMAAIPADLAPAALFGSARGAFTGSHKAAVGYFQQAEGGTLFLDEIGDAPGAVQPLLLRALQQREIQTVGGPVQQVDLRVISATDATLEGEGCDFRAALRHRLGSCEIHILPLREHPEDIGELLLHFLDVAAVEAGRENLLPGPHSSELDVAAWADLFQDFLGYPWPGNVRELANLSRQVILASGGALTVPDSIADKLSQSRMQPGAAGRANEKAQEQADESLAPETLPRRRIRQVEDTEFDEALLANGYEFAGTARQLNVSRQSVYRRIKASERHRLPGEVPMWEVREALAAQGDDCEAAARQLRVSVAGLRARLRSAGIHSR